MNVSLTRFCGFVEGKRWLKYEFSERVCCLFGGMNFVRGGVIYLGYEFCEKVCCLFEYLYKR